MSDIPESGPESDDALVTATGGGDARAFAQLLQRHRDLVTRVAYRLTGGDWSLAEDVAQETFLRLWNAAERYEGRGTLRSYLLTVAHRLATDYRRKRRETESLDGWTNLPDAKPHPGQTTGAGDVVEAVRRSLEALPEEQRTVFILSHYEGLKYREIAEIVGCPPGTVASRKYLAVQALRERLAPLLNGSEGGLS